ncbi:hypothetical protein [Streptomyces cellostaticus]|nr:hypothetical protein [Streptomyces cellostaticus]
MSLDPTASLEADKRMACHRHLLATRAHLLEFLGEHEAMAVSR